MNKRMISMLLALVMVLSMLPVPALAEEVPAETVVEEIVEPAEEQTAEMTEETTVPVETTEETTVPEETIEETTAPEETAAPEEGTVPQETVLEETIPQETILEETIPEETIVEIVNEEAPEEPNEREVIDGSGYTIEVDEEQFEGRVLAGEAVSLEARLLDEDGNPSDKGIMIWELSRYSDRSYVNLTAAGRLSVQPYILARRTILVQVSVVSLDENLDLSGVEVPDPFEIEIGPKAQEMKLQIQEPAGTEPKDVKNAEFLYNLEREDLEDGIDLTAVILPEDADDDVDWEVKDPWKLCSYTITDETGENVLHIKSKDGKKTGNVTVTATANDGSGVYAKMTVRFVRIATSVEIQGVKLNANDEYEMRGGTSVALTTNVSSMTGLSDRTILWTVTDVPLDEAGNVQTDDDGKLVTDVEGKSKFASITPEGVLVTKPVTDETLVVVRAKIKENPEADVAELLVRICPAVTSITLKLPEGTPLYHGVDGKVLFDENETIDLGVLGDTLIILPEQASKNVKWVSSDKDVATVDDAGVVTMVDAGKVRITCEALDGSNVRGILNLEIVKPVSEVTIEEKYDPATGEELVDEKMVVLRGTASMDLHATTWMDRAAEIKAGNQKVIWEIGQGLGGEFYKTNDYASISSTGRVTGKSVTRNTIVYVRATAVEKNVDGNPVLDEMKILVKPSQQRTFQFKVNGVHTPDPELNGNTLLINMGDTYAVHGQYYDSDKGLEGEDVPVAPNECIFSSSNTKVVEIDENGNLTANNAGSATITVQWIDPQNNKLHTSKVKVQVQKLVRSVSITQPKNDYVRSGSSLTLKATAWTDETNGLKATNQKFTWEIFELDDLGNEVECEIATVTTGGRVTAKNVTRNQMVRVYAISTEDDVSTSIDLMIRPKQKYVLEVGYDKGGTELETGTVTVNIADKDLSKLVLTLYISDPDHPMDGCEETIDIQDIIDAKKLTSSNKKVVTADASGDWYMVGTGKTTLTAKYVNGKINVTGKITLNVVSMVDTIRIAPRGTVQDMISGKTLSLTAILNEGGATPTNKGVLWSFEDGQTTAKNDDGKVIASINPRSGTVTVTRGLTEQYEVTVKATALDRLGTEEEFSVTQPFTIYPITTKVVIYDESGNEVGKRVDAELDAGTMTFSFAIERDEALQKVKWTTSRATVAEIEPQSDGSCTVTLKKTGSVLIKATAADGSGKSASFTLVIAK